MKFEIYHQAGFRHKWNLQSIDEDGTGDGIIFGARYLQREVIEALPVKVKEKAIFDPQFFLPSIPKGELSTYKFFPQIAADGFTTSEYAKESAGISAVGCVDFQVNNRFRYIVIPTRYVSGMPSDFIATQNSLFVGPFLEAIATHTGGHCVLLQLVLTDDMLKDGEYSADLLNWITGLEGIGGVYLIAEQRSSTKQIKDADFLYRLLSFVSALRANDMRVVLGYLNTEAVLLSLADPSAVSMGAYENLRAFRIKTFEESKKKQRGPSPRLYIGQCLQWIDRNYHGAIQRRLPDGDLLFDQNKYQAIMFQPSYNWHFSKPELYKHHFLELSRQLREIAEIEGEERYRWVGVLIQRAATNFQRMADCGIVLDQDNDGSHLAAWMTAASEFAADKGWAQQT